MADRDLELLAALKTRLGTGTLFCREARKPQWLPECTLVIASYRAHFSATIPFCDQFLLPCAKRKQYDGWKQRLMEEYERSRTLASRRSVRGRSICRVEGCEKPVRGRGLCRSHYYHETGY